MADDTLDTSASRRDDNATDINSEDKGVQQQSEQTQADNSSNNASSDNKGGEAQGYWPADWRTNFAGEDEKLLKRFERYDSPAAVAKALIAAQNKISSGELKPTLGQDASDEEVTEYRKAMGIPEKPDGYDLDLGNGLIIGEDDKPLVEQFLNVAHETNQTPEQVKSNLRAYYAVTEQLAAQRDEQDKEIQQNGEEALRTEWGGEFRGNINRIHGMLDTVMDADTKNSFLSGRLADGTPIGSSPEVLKGLIKLALEANPASTVVPAGTNQAAAISDEIATIEKTMRENRKVYDKDEKMQARYRDLIMAREQMKERKSA